MGLRQDLIGTDDFIGTEGCTDLEGEQTARAYPTRAYTYTACVSFIMAAARQCSACRPTCCKNVDWHLDNNAADIAAAAAAVVEHNLAADRPAGMHPAAADTLAVAAGYSLHCPHTNVLHSLHVDDPASAPPWDFPCSKEALLFGPLLDKKRETIQCIDGLCFVYFCSWRLGLPRYF